MKFEEAYNRLEEISKLMNNSELPLEEVVALYSEAAKLVETCKKLIEEAKVKITDINGNEICREANN